MTSGSGKSRRDVEQQQRMMADVWPPPHSDDNGDSTLAAYWVDAVSGTSGNEKNKCALIYTVQKLKSDGSGGTGEIVATAIAMTGNGRRGDRGAMNAGHIGLGGTPPGGTFLLFWVDETPAGGKHIPVKVMATGGGTDGTDTGFASWLYDVYGMDGSTLLASGASVLKSRMRFGHVETAGDFSIADGIDNGDGSFSLWDVSETYGTGTCPV